MEYTRKLLEGILDPFLIKDLAALCFSYCEVKEYLVREFLQEEECIIVRGLAFCRNLYIFDDYWGEYCSKIRSFSPDGKLLRTWNATAEGEKIERISGISGIPSRGELYTVDSMYGCIQVFSMDGKYLRQWKIGGFNHLYYSICASLRNEIFVNTEDTVEVFNPRGKLLRRWSNRDVSWRGMTVSPENEVYLGDCEKRQIQVFNSEGKFLRKWKLVNDDIPFGGLDLAISPHNEVYVTSTENNRFQVYSLQGVLLRDSDENIYLETPSRIAISPGNEVCIIDENCVHMLDLRM